MTVGVLRRFSTNVVDVMEPGGEYMRVLGNRADPFLVRVRQIAPDALGVRLTCSEGGAAAALTVVGRMLGTTRQTPEFERGAREIPWLRALAERMRGVRPPRYPTLWEACANAVVFQQISLHAASAIMRRIVMALSAPVKAGSVELRAFPDAATFAQAADETLRAAGLSSAKIAALRGLAASIGTGELREAPLEERASPAAVALLCEHKGIGAWTAAVILLRGLGRLDVFPARDSGVARGLQALVGSDVDLPAALTLLGAERGMLYYHLLLARLEASGALQMT